MPRIDANVIIRHLTQEPTEQAECATRLFQQIERGELSATIDEITVAEVVWTLSSFYRVHATEIAASMLQMLAQHGIHCPEGEVVRTALFLFSNERMGFADALLCAKMIDDGDYEIYSFDRHFDRIQGIIRREPN